MGKAGKVGGAMENTIWETEESADIWDRKYFF